MRAVCLWVVEVRTLEDKTTELRDDNHQLKLDIQELNQEIGEHKSKIAALKQDKEKY